ncbi:MAG TPA: RNA polymerase factor sigma-32 [Thermodesulfobacteriota bacterium]|nr:RNA polymerase factor sigma-32 [Thermodesulfobacteriota bacterium]
MREIAVRDSLTIFLKEVENYPVLSREEERALAVKYYEEKDYDSARRLVVSNLRFVVKIASEYVSYGFPLVDLIQEGAVGLMQAVKKFNPYKGYRLISYAVWWIRARIHNFIMRSWSLVKIGTTQAQRKLFQKLGRGKKQLKIDEGEELDGKNWSRLADLFGVKEDDVIGMEMRMASRDFSLDQASSEDQNITYLDSISDYRPNHEEVIESVQTKELMQKGLQDGLDHLSPRERYVIEKRYLTIPNIKLKDLGEELDISKERVRQIETQALKKLRGVIENHLNSDVQI